MKLVIAIPIVTLMVGIAALWISTGAVIAAQWNSCAGFRPVAPNPSMAVQQTSRDAFKKVQPELVTKELQVLRSYEEHGPMTDKEMAFQIHMPAALVSARRNSLVKQGYVI